jgi:hypothetical protein
MADQKRGTSSAALSVVSDAKSDANTPETPTRRRFVLVAPTASGCANSPANRLGSGFASGFAGLLGANSREFWVRVVLRLRRNPDARGFENPDAPSSGRRP